MADLKISQLTGATTPLAGTEVVPLVQSSSTKKVAVSDLTAGRDVSVKSLTSSDLTASSAVATDANKKLVSVANTGTGNNVLANSPVLTTPDIGNASGTNLTLGTATQKANLPGWRYYSEGDGYDTLVCTNNGGFAKYTAHTNTGAQNFESYFVGLGSTNVNVGSITSNGTGVTYGSASDYRLKENVQPMVGALAKIMALKPCTYTWKIDGSVGQGFIAHELQEVVPDAVTGVKDGTRIQKVQDEEGNVLEQEVPEYQNVDTSFVVATLVAAIQELKAEFDLYKNSHP